jgi:DNA transposition AAA+ family ATPase
MPEEHSREALEEAITRQFPNDLYGSQDRPWLREALAHKDAEKRLHDKAEPLIRRLEALLAKAWTLSRIRAESGLRAKDIDHLLGRSRILADHIQCSHDWTLSSADAAAERLARWLDEVAQVGDAETPTYADTPTHVELYNLMIDASTKKRLVVIVGGYGVGKTSAAERAATDCPRVLSTPGLVLFRASETDRTIAQFLRRLYLRLVNREDVPATVDLMGEIRKLLRAGDVVVIDEGSLLASCGGGRVVEVIRELYDTCPASWVLLGNERVTKSGNLLDTKLYGAFASRARVFPTQFLYTSAADVEAYMRWRGLEGVRLRQVLVKLFAKMPGEAPPVAGGIRAIDTLCKNALAANEGAALTSSTLLDYLQSLQR